MSSLHREREGDDDVDKGPLVRVELGPGRYGMMHRQDAVEAGLIAAPKRRRPAEDKKRRPEGDKGKRESGKRDSGFGIRESGKGADDFAIIRGIGAATAKRLYARGIDTFEQLRAADVSDLPGRVRRAIEDWRAE